MVGKTECMDMDGWVSFSFSWPSLGSLARTNEQGLCGIDGRRESLRRTVMGSSKDYYYTATRITQEREGKSSQAVEYKLPPPPQVTRTMEYKLNQTLAHDRLLTIVVSPPQENLGVVCLEQMLPEDKRKNKLSALLVAVTLSIDMIVFVRCLDDHYHH